MGESRVREADREGGGGLGDKGQPHTIKLCSVGLPRPASSSQALLHYTDCSPLCLPLSRSPLLIGPKKQA